MASLEELLAEEGFNRGRSKMIPRKSIGLETRSMPLYQDQQQHRPGSSSGVRKTERAKSDIPRYHFRGEFPTNDKVKGRNRKDNLSRQDRESMKETRWKNERRSSQGLWHGKKVSVGSFEDLASSASVGTASSHEIVEVEEQDNEVYSDEESETKYDINEKSSFRPLSEKDIEMDKKFGYSSNKNSSLQNSSYNFSKKSSFRPPVVFDANSQNRKKSDEIKSRKKADIEQNIATPALDEAAIRAIISIVNGYAKRFLKEEDFRASHCRSSFASLNLIGVEEGLYVESKVVANLEEAVDIVERAAAERSNAKELKKASLQLSVITGLNSNDLKDGYTSGIPNCKLSACAHLYLGMIYKLQKKDKAAAKHLLQVFCDSPFQARVALLPDLWDQIFLPHLMHVKAWYDKEVDSLANSQSKTRKLKLLEKVYNEILDSGTYQFAAYYKDWLTEGAEAPLLPSIQIPSVPVQLVPQEELDNLSLKGGIPVGNLPSQLVVSRKLYDTVFRHSTRPGTEVVDCDEESFDISARSSSYAALDENSSFEMVKRTVQAVKPDAANRLDHMSRVEEAERSYLGTSPEKDCRSDSSNCHMRQGTSDSLHMCYEQSTANANEVILKMLAKGVFELQQPEKFINHTGAEMQGNCVYSEAGNFFSSIPQDFMCPLTELVLEDPVTLETGHTFERSAIVNWFARGNRTCPVTGKTLECQSVPLGNFILKRVIYKWKLEHHGYLMDLTLQIEDNLDSKDEIAVFILEQLLVTSTQEERTKYAQLLISLGGLQFLIRRFQCGSIEEKMCISALLLSCILVDAGCRNHVAMNIDKLALLDLLYSKSLKSRSTAMSLLTELICLNRRKDAKSFLEALQKEDIKCSLHTLMNYLQSCKDEQRPQVALLILHFDLLVEPQKYSVYREEAVDAITIALETSLYHQKVREKCCRTLLVLGGYISSAGKIMTEDWILKEAGFLHGPTSDSPDVEEAYSLVDEDPAVDVDEGEAREKWLVHLSATLLGDGNKSFLEAVSMCLVSGFPELVRVCLTTVAWLSSGLASLSDAGFQLSAFSALISGLRACLEHCELVEHRVLASFSLLNFTKFPECRLLLMTMAEEIAGPLESLEEVTWTAKDLYAIICT